LAVTSEYVLRFKIASPTYDDTTDQLSSTGFIIQGEAAKTTTTSSSSLASSTSTSSPTSNTPPAQTSLTNKPGSSGLSGGAKAGIAIGVVVVVLGAAALVWFFFMAGRGRGMAPEASSSGTGIQLVDKKGSPTQPVELGETWQQQQQHAELQGDWQQHPSELPAR
jgi:hypothetical protein